MRLEPGQRRVDGPAGGHAPDAGVPEPGRDQALQGQGVTGAVDDLRRDAAPGPGVFELCLAAPPASPGDQVQLVEDAEPGGSRLAIALSRRVRITQGSSSTAMASTYSSVSAL